ncbi:MAG: sulfite exporter TauE/SafE family protein [Spirochaetales bacterium]
MSDVTFCVRGMHCPACESLIDELVAGDPNVAQVTTTRRDTRVRARLIAPEDPSALQERWNAVLAPHGYQLTPENAKRAPISREQWWGMGAGAAFLVLFGLLQASGLVTLFSPDTLELPGSFLLGLLASVSSCFALVGGLLMTFTASVGQRNSQALPAALTAFHGVRLATFFVLGGVLGQLGEALALDPVVFTVLFALAAATMIGLGLSLLGLDLLAWLPGRSGKKVTGLSNRLAQVGTVGGGALLGLGTFFLPCGFTQTVQFQALAAGGFWNGGLLMLAFALGTLPVLLLLSVALKTGLEGRSRAVLLAASGVVVLGLGLFQLQSVLVLTRVMRPLLAF